LIRQIQGDGPGEGYAPAVGGKGATNQPGCLIGL
jgi:hypothetical protein